MSATRRVTAGFLPLLDSALLVVAREQGFAAAEGIDLALVREHSWASVRDRLAVGHFDVAHLLAPMPIACNLGLTPLSPRTVAPMALGLGGNAITVSLPLWQALLERGSSEDFDPASTGAALRAAIGDGWRGGRDKPCFAVVHPHSAHHYELRYWLAAAGIRAGIEVEIIVVPPPLMVDALAAGRIDGYCVGEPWNSAAVACNVGRILTTKAAIWKSSPEKVLGVAAAWADGHPEQLAGLLRALYRAALWCEAPGNHAELARLLARPGYVGCPAEWLLPALTGQIATGSGSTVAVPDFFVPHARGANIPRPVHALWFYSQMLRWNQVQASPDNQAIAAGSYRPDLYAAALGPLGVEPAAADIAASGLGADCFFDRRAFLPEDIEGYLATLPPSS